MKNSEKAGVV